MHACQSPTSISCAQSLVWQREVLTTISIVITHWIECLTRSLCVMRVSRSLECGSRAHDQARGTSLALLVTGILWVLITFIGPPGVNESASRAMFLKQVHIA